jgi:hypothetical protein
MILDPEAIRFGNRRLCHRHHPSGLAATRLWQASGQTSQTVLFKDFRVVTENGSSLARLTKKAGRDKYGGFVN